MYNILTVADSSFVPPTLDTLSKVCYFYICKEER